MKKVFRTWKFIECELCYVGIDKSTEDWAKELLSNIKGWCKTIEGLTEQEIHEKGYDPRDSWMVLEDE